MAESASGPYGASRSPRFASRQSVRDGQAAALFMRNTVRRNGRARGVRRLRELIDLRS